MVAYCLFLVYMVALSFILRAFVQNCLPLIKAYSVYLLVSISGLSVMLTMTVYVAYSLALI